MGDVGLVAKLVDTVFRFFTNEDGLTEMLKRRRLHAKKLECQKALDEHRWDDLARLTAELERLANEPCGCASPPAPCNCSLQEAALTHYTSKYLDTLQDVGALREALKICEERAH